MFYAVQKNTTTESPVCQAISSQWSEELGATLVDSVESLNQESL